MGGKLSPLCLSSGQMSFTDMKNNSMCQKSKTQGYVAPKIEGIYLVNNCKAFKSTKQLELVNDCM